MRKQLLVMFFSLTLLAGVKSADAATVTWGSAGFTGSNDCCGATTNSNDFDEGQLLFAGFYADSLDDISGSGIWHLHGPSAHTITLDLLLDGTWVNVFTTTASTGSLASILTPINFAYALVTGIRLDGNPGSSNTFHSMNGTTFEFSTQVAPVPLPAALPLFGSVIAGMYGFGWLRRRRQRLHPRRELIAG